MRLSHRPAGEHLEPHQLRPRRRTLRQDGYVMTLFGLMLVPMLLMAGLAVDVGYWYNRASDIQKAADAASLAGVVWLPDLTKATTVAKDVAKRNGFDDAASNVTVTVTQSLKAPRRLKVVITDSTVGSFFWKNLNGHNISLSRSSFAEYVTPVPMGSPRNYFGTGKLITADPELLYESVNPYCTDKVQGDRHQSRYFGGTCASALNDDYRTTGYEMYIDAVAGRVGTIDVRIYDARYNGSDTAAYTAPGPDDCTTTYAYTYPAQTTTGWTNQTTDTTLTGPKQYQTRANTTTTTWSAVSTLTETQTVGVLANRARYRGPTTTTPTTTCTPTTVQKTDNAIDMNLANSNQETYTYTLYYADNTPLDDTDNDVKCTKSFTKTSAFDGYTYLGSGRWNSLCSIADGDPSGRYILRVQNAGAVGSTASGANQYGVVAKFVNAAGDGLCDGRTDTLCPRVYGKDAISVYANTSDKAASFYLAEIGAEHTGKKLKLELWDPGEGGSTIQIMKPTAADTWSPVSFTWKVGTGATSTTSSLDVTSSVFNGKLVEITVDLAGYVPPASNAWWQIKYTFTSGTVTDRTTWSARILGDPVHLIEEN